MYWGDGQLYIAKRWCPYEEEENAVRCLLCNRLCIISEGKSGFCKVRINIKGKLYTLTYGNLSAMESRPIEIKPFFHFYPGTYAYTISTWGCNFRCKWCQNFYLSWVNNIKMGDGHTLPQKIIEIALKNGDDGICISFQEPTLLYEYALDLFKLCSKHGLYGCFVSNGYLTKESLLELKNAGMQGINIDLKGDEEIYSKYCGGVTPYPVLENIKYAIEIGLHVEVICLLVTDLSARKDVIDWLLNKLSEYANYDTPIHFTKYYPANQYIRAPTPRKALDYAKNMAKEIGFDYVYLGNVPDGLDTHCPKCGCVVIERTGHSLQRNHLINGRCPFCNTEIHLFP